MQQDFQIVKSKSKSNQPPPSALQTVGALGRELARLSKQLEDTATRELPKIATQEECAGLDVEEVVAHGDAASEIVRVARERNVDLIVISSHGRTGLGRILFGSTAESVVRHAPCPVLVVKPPEEP